MKVILLKEVQGLGHAGEIKDVSEGYARNFLLERGLADIITKHKLEVLQAQKNKRELTIKKDLKNKKKLAGKLNGKLIAIKVKADEKGSLYFKITPKLIVEELAKQNIKINEKDLKLVEPIKKIGVYVIGFVIAGETGKIKLEITSE